MARLGARMSASAATLPRLLALKTAVPPYVLDQTVVSERVRVQFSGRRDVERLLPVFGNTGIERRYSCVPIEWYAEPHGWKDRTALYVQRAVQLFETVALACLAEAKLAPEEIDAIVTVSTTGVATPSLDALLVERMGLRRDIKRLPISASAAPAASSAWRAQAHWQRRCRARKCCSLRSNSVRSPFAEMTCRRAISWRQRWPI